MAKWLLASAVALSLTGCANHLQTVDQRLHTALAGQPVIITKQDSGGLGSLINQSGTITLISSADYLYPTGGWNLKPGAPVLSKMVPIFRTFQKTTITVIGYTDNTPYGPVPLGSSQAVTDNTQLSLKRASEAVSYFQSQGVRPNLLDAQGYGESNPVASNDTPEGRAKNRRIEIVLKGDGT